MLQQNPAECLAEVRGQLHSLLLSSFTLFVNQNHLMSITLHQIESCSKQRLCASFHKLVL